MIVNLISIVVPWFAPGSDVSATVTAEMCGRRGVRINRQTSLLSGVTNR